MGLFPAQLSLVQIKGDGYLPPLEKSLGFKITELGDHGLAAEFTVDARHLQPHGILHGGVSCLIGESLGSIAGNLMLLGGDKVVVGQSLNAMHIRPAMPGTLLRAIAEPLHIGSRSQIWEIRISDKLREKLVCKVSLTLAVVDKRLPG